MRTVGKILVIWGALLPLIAFPSMRGFHAELGVLGSLFQMYLLFGGTRVTYGLTVTVSLITIGVGLTLWLTDDRPRR